MRAFVLDNLPEPREAWAKGGSTAAGREQYALKLQTTVGLMRNAASNPVVTVTFVSKPAPARVTLVPKYVSDGRVDFTRATFANVNRGKYIYEVTLQGYKTAREELDLVSSANGAMDCTLAPESSSDISSCLRK